MPRQQVVSTARIVRAKVNVVWFMVLCLKSLAARPQFFASHQHVVFVLPHCNLKRAFDGFHFADSRLFFQRPSMSDCGEQFFTAKFTEF